MLEERTKFCSIDSMILYLDVIYNINAMLYRGFALPYIMRLKESVFSNLLESPNGNLRNFTKEKIDMVIRIM